MRLRVHVLPAALSVALAAGLGLAACSRSDEKAQRASADATTTSSSDLSITGEEASSTTAPAVGGGASSTTRRTLSSTTIAYFTVPSSTTEVPVPGDYPPGESVGRRFTDAVMDGNRSAAAALAPKSVLDQFEPWKPFERKTVDGVSYPTYRYSGGTARGEFDFSPKPTVFNHCKVDRGKVTSCAVGD